MGIASSFFSRFRASKPEKQDDAARYRAVYPESVRYAFQYKAAQMGIEEMRSLVHEYMFETVYLVTKAMAFDRSAQRSFLELLTRLYVRPDWTHDELRSLLRQQIDLLPAQTSIAAAKLMQINRYGSEHWANAFHQLAQTIYEQQPDAIPCLIAHTPIFAYHEFIRVYRQRRDSTLLLLMPSWMEDQEEIQMGYQIELGELPSVRLQVKDQCIFGHWRCMHSDCKLRNRYCGNTIFVDDTINTGSTEGRIQSFWQTEYGLKLPESKVYVLTDMRKHTAAPVPH
jgi:hypothetical protein